MLLTEEKLLQATLEPYIEEIITIYTQISRAQENIGGVQEKIKGSQQTLEALGQKKQFHQKANAVYKENIAIVRNGIGQQIEKEKKYEAIFQQLLLYSQYLNVLQSKENEWHTGKPLATIDDCKLKLTQLQRSFFPQFSKPKIPIRAIDSSSEKWSRTIFADMTDKSDSRDNSSAPVQPTPPVPTPVQFSEEYYSRLHLLREEYQLAISQLTTKLEELITIERALEQKQVKLTGEIFQAKTDTQLLEQQSNDLAKNYQTKLELFKQNEEKNAAYAIKIMLLTKNISDLKNTLLELIEKRLTLWFADELEQIEQKLKPCTEDSLLSIDKGLSNLDQASRNALNEILQSSGGIEQLESFLSEATEKSRESYNTELGRLKPAVYFSSDPEIQEYNLESATNLKRLYQRAKNVAELNVLVPSIKELGSAKGTPDAQRFFEAGQKAKSALIKLAEENLIQALAGKFNNPLSITWGEFHSLQSAKPATCIANFTRAFVSAFALTTPEHLRIYDCLRMFKDAVDAIQLNDFQQDSSRIFVLTKQGLIEIFGEAEARTKNLLLVMTNIQSLFNNKDNKLSSSQIVHCANILWWIIRFSNSQVTVGEMSEYATNKMNSYFYKYSDGGFLGLGKPEVIRNLVKQSFSGSNTDQYNGRLVIDSANNILSLFGEQILEAIKHFQVKKGSEGYFYLDGLQQYCQEQMAMVASTAKSPSLRM